MSYDINFYNSDKEKIEWPKDISSVEIERDSCCRTLASPIITPEEDLAKHCYEICLKPNKCQVKRDGVVLDEVEGIEIRHSNDINYPEYLLTLICASTVKPFNSLELFSDKEDLPRYSIKRKNYDCLEVYRNKELIEEAVKVELAEGREWECISRMKLTVIAKVNLHLDYTGKEQLWNLP